MYEVPFSPSPQPSVGKERAMAVHLLTHPLVRHKTGLLRQDNISTKDFRELASELAMLLLYEATRDLQTDKETINCWSGPVEVDRIRGKQLTLVPVLRAGFGMLDGCLRLVPGAKVSTVGIYRDEETLEPHQYFWKPAGQVDQRLAVILDPMLATGGTAVATVDLLKQAGCQQIRGLFLVAAPEGIAKLTGAHPDVDIYLAAQDERLNGDGYILPGLGDAGDKLFGTK